MNESGWLADEVIAAGALRHGKPPSALTALTGLVLIEMARRRSRLLPRQVRWIPSSRASGSRSRPMTTTAPTN